ncbi:hypothetical protein PI125_g16151 [Phytophthora idaei]|nr:hypothetical protein PI125_g16151 [Phytophthora idaei]KAG3142361.1 hypothetical protein PI126_g15077 [Phytophthora idaei]
MVLDSERSCGSACGTGRRALGWVVGLNNVVNELVGGAALYAPMVQQARRYRKKSGLEQAGITCGVGHVLLLCGASGTSEAMTVNAVAHDLKKRVLLVDFPSLQISIVTDANLRDIFHEADMSNAVLFFDEWENIFLQHDGGATGY